MEVRDATVGPLSGTRWVSGRRTTTCEGSTTQSVGSDLSEDGECPLAHLHIGCPDLHLPVGESGHVDHRVQMDLPAPGEAGSMEERGQADASPPFLVGVG